MSIYTDGGCRGNPGIGGYAVVIYEDTTPVKHSGAERNTTSSRMEIKAAEEGLKALKNPSKIRLYSDSSYLIDAFTKGWLTKWKRNGWRKADKKPVKNCDLWKELLEAARPHDIEWVKVEGHAGNPGNELCDRLVRIAMDRGAAHGPS